MKRDLKFMEEILSAKSPSSVENEGIKVWDNFMSGLHGFTHTYEDNIKNSGWSIGHGSEKVLLSGHIDEIALSVISIDSDGFITLASMAGADKKCLPGSKLLVLADSGKWIPGIIHKAPLHIEHVEKTIDKVCNYKELKLDVGASSKEEVENMGIFPGSPVVFDRNIILEFGENKVVGNALDDKAAIYVISQVAAYLSELDVDNPIFYKYKFIFLAGTQEETGCRGLTVASKNINPDISIDLDVTFACDGGLVTSGSAGGEVYLGKGPVIEFGPDKNREIALELVNLAKEKEIPYQRAFSRNGGTDTNTIQLSSKDCKTVLLSIPNMSMHTQNETCDWRDLGACVDLIISYFTK
jgi:endoglucanase